MLQDSAHTHAFICVALAEGRVRLNQVQLTPLDKKRLVKYVVYNEVIVCFGTSTTSVVSGLGALSGTTPQRDTCAVLCIYYDPRPPIL